MIGILIRALEFALCMSLVSGWTSLPVDSELRECYAWESRAFAKQEKAAQRLREQRAKLKLLGAGRQWEGNLRLRDRPGDPWESRWVHTRELSCEKRCLAFAVAGDLFVNSC